MKKLLLIIVVTWLSFCSVAQNTEGIYSFNDYPISTIDIQTDYSYINTFVRKTDVGDETQYYYVLKAVLKDTRTSIVSTFVTMISYEDLKKINSALKILLDKEEYDWKSGISEIFYSENKFVTESGFGIGYCIDNGRLEWFVESDYYGAINGWKLKDRVIDNKAFSINNGNDLENSFGKAQTKIESLMQ